MISNIIFREATLDDVKLLYVWQCNPETRKFFFNSEAPSWEQHQVWMEKSITSSSRILLIAEQAEQPVGVLRYDLQNQDAEVSIYLDPEQKGRGLGGVLLQKGSCWIKQKFPKIELLQARIFAGNTASEKAFIKAGFSLKYSVYTYHLNEEESFDCS